jgi:TrmH family RNA methyltransferase
MKNLSVILISPQGPANVGGIARLMGNFDLTDLRIVQPRCDLKSLEAKKMSMRSFPILEGAKVYETLADAQADRSFSVAFSDRDITLNAPQYDVYDFAKEATTKFSDDEKIALVFGREDSGMELEELSACNWQIYIPTGTEKTSINLTSAVAIALSSLFHASQKGKREKPEFKKAENLPPKERENVFFKELYKLMEEVQFLNKQNPFQIRDDLKAVFHRAQPDDRELRIMMGLLANTKNYIQNQGWKKASESSFSAKSAH